MNFDVKESGYGLKYKSGESWDVNCKDCISLKDANHAGGWGEYKCLTLKIMIDPSYGCYYANRILPVSVPGQDQETK